MPTAPDDAETLVRSRAIADAIMRELQGNLRRPPPPPVRPRPAPPFELDMETFPLRPSPVPNVFETPWTPADPLPPWASTKRTMRKRRRKEGSKLHWAVLGMAAAIAVGLWLDPPARTNAASQLRATSQHLVAKLPPALASRL